MGYTDFISVFDNGFRWSGKLDFFVKKNVFAI